MPIVIDASIAAAWCLVDEATPATDAVLDRLREDSAVVPAIWPLEITNVLLISERRGRLSPSEFAQAADFLSGLVVSIDTDALPHTLNSIPALSRTHRLSAYDAAYLELAMRRGLPLATLDQDLIRAAENVGVPIV